MRLRNITIKAIPYIAVLTMAVGLMGCSGGDNADINRNTEITSTTEDVVGKGDSVDSTDNTASDNTGSDETTGNETANNSGGDNNNNSSSNNSSSGNGSASGGNSGSNNTGSTGNTGTGNNKKPSGNTSGSGSNGGTSLGNTGSSNSGSNTGSSGSSGSTGSSGSSNSSGSSSGDSSGSSGGVTFVDYVQETTYEYSSSKVDSYTNKYTTTEVTKSYERYSDGSKIELGEGYTSRVPVGEMVLTVKETAEYTYVKSECNGIQYMNDEQKNLYNKWHDSSFYSATSSEYYMRKSDGMHFADEKTLLADNVAQTLVKELGLDNTSVSKEKRLFTLLKWMENNVIYNAHSKYSSNPYGCLVDRQCDCEGYASTICMLLNYTDIPVKYVGASAYTHAWNIVQLDDGYWYEVDGTYGVSDGCEGEKEEYLIFYFRHIKGHILDIRDYLKSGQTCKYTGTINYAEPANIKSEFPLINDYDKGYWTEKIFIKGSDLTH